MNSQVVFVDVGRPPFVFSANQKVITIPMKLFQKLLAYRKSLKDLLNINATARLAWGQLSILK